MSRRIIRRLGALTLVLLTVYVTFLLGIFVAMHQSVERFGRVMSYMPGPLFMVIPFEPMWTTAREGRLEVGDSAPDFVLRAADKTGHSPTGGQVQLASFRGRQPVVLVFGSYT
jgi:predicted PurR-regulated permease PerM